MRNIQGELDNNIIPFPIPKTKALNPDAYYKKEEPKDELGDEMIDFIEDADSYRISSINSENFKDFYHFLIKGSLQKNDHPMLIQTLDRLEKIMDVIEYANQGRDEDKKIYLFNLLFEANNLKAESDIDHSLIFGREKLRNITKLEQYLLAYRDLIHAYLKEDESSMQLINNSLKKCRKLQFRIELSMIFTKIRYYLQTSGAFASLLFVDDIDRIIKPAPQSFNFEELSGNIEIPQLNEIDLQESDWNALHAEHKELFSTFLQLEDMPKESLVKPFSVVSLSIKQGNGITQAIYSYLIKHFDENSVLKFFNQKSILDILNPLIIERPDTWQDGKLPKIVRAGDNFKINQDALFDAVKILEKNPNKAFVRKEVDKKPESKMSDDFEKFKGVFFEDTNDGINVGNKDSIDKAFFLDENNNPIPTKEVRRPEFSKTEKLNDQMSDDNPTTHVSARHIIGDSQHSLFGSNKVDLKKPSPLRIDMDNYNQTLAMLYANSDGPENLKKFPSVRQYFVDQLSTYISLSKNIDANLMSGIFIDYFIELLSKNYGTNHANYDIDSLRNFFDTDKNSQKWLWNNLNKYLEKNSVIGMNGDRVINFPGFQQDILGNVMKESKSYYEKKMESQSPKGGVRNFFGKIFKRKEAEPVAMTNADPLEIIIPEGERDTMEYLSRIYDFGILYNARALSNLKNNDPKTHSQLMEIKFIIEKSRQNHDSGKPVVHIPYHLKQIFYDVIKKKNIRA